MDEEKEPKKEKKPADIFDLLNLRIFGVDIGDIIRSWTGVTDVKSLIENPEGIEELKGRIEEMRSKLQEAQRELREKYGDAVRIDYDIRLGGILGGPDEIRLGGGEFFKRLDKLARERVEWRSRRGAARKPIPVRRITVPKETGFREPYVEVLRENEHLEVVAELPGVEERDIKLDVAEKKMVIHVEVGDRKYHSETMLPVEVEPTPLERSYKNGVLRLKMKTK